MKKEKPFQLVKYFTYSSLIVIFLGTIVLSFLNTHWAKEMQIEKSEVYAQLLVENLNHQVFLRFIIPVALKYGKIQLRNPEQFEWMDKVVRGTLHSLKVEMVNIFDKNSVISYSFDKEKVGKQDIGGSGYKNAINGKVTSRLLQRGNFWQILFGYPEKTTMITFAPLRAEKPLASISGPVLGVVEIEQDLSEEYHSIFRFQIFTVLTSTTVMGILFLILIFVVKRGESIIHTRTLERIRLKEKLNRAERLSSIGEMAAGISHEIRNPLGIIRSSAELLKKKMAKFDPETKIPDIIVEEAGRLNNIITDFLDFASPRTPNTIPCSITDIIEKNITFLSPQIEAGGYIVQRNYTANLPGIMADADMLYQAFLNIFINAMQAMPGGGQIHVGISSDENDVTIFIEDEGDGLPENLADKIWDPFFTTKEKGTGLGLGIVKNIIESHGGAIRIDNREPKGARMTIELPIIQDNRIHHET